VLINKDPVATTNNLGELTKKEIVAKAIEELDKMKSSGRSRLESMRIMGVKKLRNGGIVYKLSSVEAAKWLRGERTAFMENFRGTSIVKKTGGSLLSLNTCQSHTPQCAGRKQED